MAEAVFIGLLTWVGQVTGVRWYLTFPLGIGLWTVVALVLLVVTGTFSFTVVGCVTLLLAAGLSQPERWGRWRLPVIFAVVSLAWSTLPLSRLSEGALWYLSLGQWAEATVGLKEGARHFLVHGPVMVLWQGAASFLGLQLLASPGFLLLVSWFGALVAWVPSPAVPVRWVALLLGGILAATPMFWVGAIPLNPDLPLGVFLFFFLVPIFRLESFPRWAPVVCLTVVAFLRIESLLLAPLLALGGAALFERESVSPHRQWHWGLALVVALEAAWLARLHTWSEGAQLFEVLPLHPIALGLLGLSLGLGFLPSRILKLGFWLGVGLVWTGALAWCTYYGIDLAYWESWYVYGGWGGLLWVLTPVLFLWGPMQNEPDIVSVNSLVLLALAGGMVSVGIHPGEPGQPWFHVLPSAVLLTLVALGLVERSGLKGEPRHSESGSPVHSKE